MAPPKGHPRWGGKPKGYKASQTLDKERAREFARQLITADLRPLIEAQLAHAKGIKYLVVRAKQGGKFVRVTQAMAKAREGLDASQEIIEVWEKDPSVQAFTDLLNRALDKPKEQPLEMHVDVAEDVLAQLALGRARNAKRE